MPHFKEGGGAGSRGLLTSGVDRAGDKRSVPSLEEGSGWSNSLWKMGGGGVGTILAEIKLEKCADREAKAWVPGGGPIAP